MKYLKGSELVEYISERQSKQVRALVQSKGIKPKLAIISTDPDNSAIRTYIKLKTKRAEELRIDLEHFELEQAQCEQKIKDLVKDSSVHGIILQLPLKDPSQTDHLLRLIPPGKDVDGMGASSFVPPATAQAVLWLLAGYNIDLNNKKLLVVGRGRLVGAPLIKLIEAQGLQVSSIDECDSHEALSLAVKQADVIISAAGSPSLIKEDMLRDSQVVIDCGTSESGGKLVGDLDPEVYNSKLDLKVTPQIGGVGPLTIGCLFENLLHLIDKQVNYII